MRKMEQSQCEQKVCYSRTKEENVHLRASKEEKPPESMFKPWYEMDAWLSDPWEEYDGGKYDVPMQDNRKACIH